MESNFTFMDKEDKNCLSEKTIDSLLKYREAIVSARGKMNKFYLEHRRQHLFQERGFFRYIIVTSLAILVLMPLILEISFHPSITIIGIVLQIFLVLFFVGYVWNLLHEEQRCLDRQQDDYNLMTMKILDVFDRYTKDAPLTKISFKKLILELENSGETQKIQEDIAHIRYFRSSKRTDLDSIGNFMLFIFITSCVLLLVGAAHFVTAPFLSIRLLIVITIIFFFCFSDFITILTQYVLRGAQYSKRQFDRLLY